MKPDCLRNQWTPTCSQICILVYLPPLDLVGIDISTDELLTPRTFQHCVYCYGTPSRKVCLPLHVPTDRTIHTSMQRVALARTSCGLSSCQLACVRICHSNSGRQNLLRIQRKKKVKFGNEQWPTRHLHGDGNRDSPVHNISEDGIPHGLK